MPVTPFHFGPGLLLKGLAPRSISLSAFVLANVVIDAESVVNLLMGRAPVHASLHTVVGSVLVGVMSGVVVTWFGRVRNARSAETAAGPALAGGVLGGLGQSLLDAIMHVDLRPFLPLSEVNPLLRAMDLGTLHAACVGAGVLGLALLWRRAR